MEMRICLMGVSCGVVLMVSAVSCTMPMSTKAPKRLTQAEKVEVVRDWVQTTGAPYRVAGAGLDPDLHCWKILVVRVLSADGVSNPSSIVQGGDSTAPQKQITQDAALALVLDLIASNAAPYQIVGADFDSDYYCWKILVEGVPPTPGSLFYISVSVGEQFSRPKKVISEQNAIELVSKRLAHSPVRYDIIGAVFDLDTVCWMILVKPLPPVPGMDFYIKVSAQDGKLVDDD